MNQDFLKKEVKRMYSNVGYITIYSPFILLSVFLIIILILIISFTKVMSNVKDIKDDWENQKCNPSVIPFAGMINPIPNKTSFESTGENYEECIKHNITNIANVHLDPLKFMTSGITDLFMIITESINFFRSIYATLRNNILDIFNNFYSIFINFLSRFKNIFMGMLNVFSKTQSLFVLS